MRALSFVTVTIVILSLGNVTSHPLECDFDRTTCSWHLEEPWIRTDTVLLPCPLNGPPHRLPAEDAFVSSQGRFGGHKQGNMTSGEFDQGMIAFSFKYFKATDTTILQVFLVNGGETTILCSISEISLGWKEQTVAIPAVDNARVIFSVSHVENGFDIVAVDTFRVHPNKAHGTLIYPKPSPDIRRAPLLADEWDEHLRPTGLPHPSSSCPAIKCSFHGDFCHWIPSGSYKIVSRKVVTEGSGSGQLSTEPVALPAVAHLTFEMFASDGSQISVFARSGSEETLVWSQSGLALSGWNRLRLPIRYSSLPTSLVIRTIVPPGGFVAMARMNAVDGEGREIKCGAASVIKPSNTNGHFQRLTALQVIEEPSQSPAPPPSVPSLFPPPPLLPPPQPLLSPFASLPIAPSIVHSISSPSSLSAFPFNSFLSPSSSLPKPSQITPPPSSPDRPRLTRLPHTRPPSPPPSTISPPHYDGPAMVRSATPSLQDIVSSIGGQPIMEGQLKLLAKKFGFNNISGARAQQALENAKRIFGAEGVRNFIQAAAGQQGTPFETPKGMKPILPINIDTPGGDRIISETALILKDIPTASSMSSAFADKVASIVSLPDHRSKSDEPFTRQNLDFVLQNAINPGNNS